MSDNVMELRPTRVREAPPDWILEVLGDLQAVADDSGLKEFAGRIAGLRRPFLRPSGGPHGASPAEV